ncbi:disease resistance protein RGA2-like [Hevea brasiliensis]|uniref:disease resistance protein RGA2-like n=1 Tax=Hevea brasiliensis TaxID=3981 RepID=UPI0025E68480|nr:disease resistance protein RGA2-like [Hevea brasiliensis]
MKKEIVTDVRDKSSGRETSSVLKPDVIGREKDKEKMIESLLNPTSSQGNVSVNAIVGIGGLGKTALAQLILECATNNEVPNLLGLEQLHIRFKENLEAKRYLLVLDDVWNEDQKKWDDLKAYLLMGAPGSKILVTTRSTRVALVMGVDSPYVLQGLADNEAWDLFDKLAFGEGHGAVMNPKLIKIGKDMLSYCQMPTYLRQCFSYCAMFPKGHEFDKETLIRLWIAQGYISKSMSHYKMHDFIHDLAQSISKDRYFAVVNVCEGIHHVYWLSSLNEIEMLVKVKGMRTLFFESFPESLQALKALELKRFHALHSEGDCGRDIIEVPNSIAKLKYLRYLDISGLDMETLPKSITNLQNLQTLILLYCIYLQELPRDIEKLISLRCLMIDGCGKLRCMPIGLGKLTCLRQLSDFVVARDEGSKGAMLNELNSLNQLRGSIYLHLLRNVENVEIESNQVNLREKKHLQFLELCWRNTYLYEGPIDKTEVEKNELLLEKLEPHPNLKSLVVESFKGLPPLDQLPYLKTLRLEDLHSLVYISDEEPSFLASTSFTSYPSLQEIELRNCFNLRGWWRKKKRSGVELAQFPCLSKMQIWGCYKLILDDGEAIEWGGLRSLQSLSFRFLSELKSLPKGLQFATNLQELIINYCDSLMALPDWIGNLTSLQWLEIYNCPNLRSLPEGMHLLTSLQKLRIARCRKLSARCMKEKGVDWPKIAHILILEIQPPGF